jgi:hypothetical protein
MFRAPVLLYSLHGVGRGDWSAVKRPERTIA